MKNNILILIHHILFIINLNLFSFLCFENEYFVGIDAKLIISMTLFSILIYKLYGYIYKTNVFILSCIIILVIGLFANYHLLDISITTENHGYLFFLIFEFFLIYQYHLHIKENGVDAKWNQKTN